MQPPRSLTPPGEAGNQIGRLAANGQVLAGNTTPEFSDAVSYAAGLADIVGELLGLDAFVSFEIGLSDHTACLMRRQSGGELLAAKVVVASDLEAIRRQLEG